MINAQTVEDYFDLETLRFKDLFLSSSNIWDPLSKLKEYLDLKAKGHIESDVAEHATLVNPSKISIGKNVTIFPGAYIEGPCVIADNALIGHCAYVRSYSLIGEFCHVGHASEIKHSILLPHAKAPHFNYVGDSILGSYVNLGAGVILANFKVNKTNVSIKYKDSMIPTEMKKLGAIIGDNSSLGCNTVTNPGTVLPKNFFCRPCSSLQGYYENIEK